MGQIYASIEDLMRRGGYNRERATAIFADMQKQHRLTGWDGSTFHGIPFRATGFVCFDLADHRYEVREGEVCHVPAAMVDVIKTRGLPLARLSVTPPDAKIAEAKPIIREATPPVPADDEDDDGPAVVCDTPPQRPLDEDDIAEAEFVQRDLEERAMRGDPKARLELEQQIDPPVPADDLAESRTRVEDSLAAAAKSGITLPRARGAKAR